MTVEVHILTPSFTLDLCTVRLTGGDYDRDDLAAVLGQARVHDAALALYRARPHPAVAYACSPGSCRALAAHLRIAGLRSTHLDDVSELEPVRQAVAGLAAGRLDVVVTVQRLAGKRPIPGLTAALLIRPTLDRELHERYLGRLSPGPDGLTVFDMVGNCERHGLLHGWRPVSTTTLPVPDVIRDPFVAKLADAPLRTAKTWAGKSPERLAMVQRAKGFKDGWTYHAVASFDADAAQAWWAERQRGDGAAA